MRLKDIGEFGFIDRVKVGCLTRSQNVIKGIGDDCCVFRMSGDLVALLTTDMLVEGIHFLRDAASPYTLGRKSLSVNISDIAAMGGIPREATVSIAIPKSLDVEYLDALYDGMKAVAREFEVNLLGGDTTASPEHLVINVALIGEAPEEEVLYRSGARPGDVIFLTGAVGASAAGLDIILTKRSYAEQEALLAAHNDPLPHVRAGRIIATQRLATALIDVSDGVASDLGHICEESRTGAVIEEALIPTSPLVRAYCEQFRLDPLRLCLHVGEDYVLLGTVPEKAAEALARALQSGGCVFHRIGVMTGDARILLKGRDGAVRELTAKGWDHFRPH